MTARRIGLLEGLQVSGVTLLLVALLPLLAAAVLLLRGVLLGGAVAAVAAAAVAFAVSGRFRSWLDLASRDAITYKGVRQPTDVALSQAHLWARIGGREATVGVDDLAQRLLGPVAAVELPRLGDVVEQGDPVFALRRGDRALVGWAPVGGEVTAVNEALLDSPGRVNASPFDRGWVVRLRGGRDLRRERRELVRGVGAADWLRREVDRLVLTMAAHDAAPTLADGGALAPELHTHVDPAMWTRLETAFFGRTRALAGRPHDDLIF
jgi:glycine cleavage system H protein